MKMVWRRTRNMKINSSLHVIIELIIIYQCIDIIYHFNVFVKNLSILYSYVDYLRNYRYKWKMHWCIRQCIFLIFNCFRCITYLYCFYHFDWIKMLKSNEAALFKMEFRFWMCCKWKKCNLYYVTAIFIYRTISEK